VFQFTLRLYSRSFFRDLILGGLLSCLFFAWGTSCHCLSLLVDPCFARYFQPPKNICLPLHFNSRFISFTGLLPSFRHSDLDHCPVSSLTLTIQQIARPVRRQPYRSCVRSVARLLVASPSFRINDNLYTSTKSSYSSLSPVIPFG
jgi:hypothetical protein